MFLREDTKTIVGTVAYLIGVRKETWEVNYEYYCEGLYNKLESNKNALVIRCLCRLRTRLMLNFKKTDDAIRFEMRNIYNQEWFDQDDIKKLQKNGVEPILTNKRASDYTTYFNRLINEKIQNCKPLFPDWVKWEYIKDLFMIPKYNSTEVQKYEFEKFMAHTELYPYQCYIFWEPDDLGNLLYTDGKFLELLYQMNNDYFGDKSKYKNAVDSVKSNIYEFINSSDKTVLVVDCENSDVYKLYSVLKNCNQDEINKIQKIMLFDDSHTTNGWDYIGKFLKIPVEHIEVDRVTDRKSLVDIKVTAGVCKEFYQNGVSSFILLSSDSDYWGLISSLPEAEFLVMIEYEKCGAAIKDALIRNNTYFCSIDDFCSGNIEEFKHLVLINELKAEIPNIVGKNGYQLTEHLYRQARLEPNDSEIRNFYEKYIKTLVLSFDSAGNISIKMK